MAAEVVGGAFLSASLQMLFDRMASQKVVDFIRGNKLNEGLLNKLKIMLLSANRVLNDAEMKQLTDPDVRKWLEELKDAIYNAEDLVYEINTEALRSEMEIQSESRTFSKVRNFFSSRITVKNVEARIVEILNTIEYLMEQKKHLGLVEGTVQTRAFPRSSAATLVEESDIYGRDADKEAIVELLLSDDEVGGEKICVIPIVGMGGIGKTTLAQLVYRDIDDRVMDKPFDIKAWITVSEEHDVSILTKSIYESVTGSQNISAKETFQVQLKLKEFLYGKKFLFVLDDVWNLTSEGWYDLQTPFKSASLGSKIIVTTRSTDIGSVMGTVPIHYLQVISEKDGWELFTNHAFKNVNPSAYADFEAIGRQIVKKCGGLPLAVKSLGSLLHTLQNPKEWENVLKNDIWELDQTKCNVLPALWLSYYYLPPHLKRCFAYCSIYPKDYGFQKENLILLWMAEDLLQPQKNKILEEVGEEYFNDLTSSSFFHRNKYGQFTMHDLVSDLAKFVSGHSCFRFDDSEALRKTRHLLCTRQNRIKDIKKLKDLSKNMVLRTLLVYGSWHGVKEYIINRERLQSMQYLRVLCEGYLIKKLLSSIGTLKLLRYLDLSTTKIEEIPDTVCTLYNLQTLLLRYCEGFVRLPDSIGNLKHLRYLDLSNTLVEKLPDTVCNLHNLHTLKLVSCNQLTCLPTNLALLTNLRNLNLEGTSLNEMPLQMSKLKYLQVLTDFPVGKTCASSIKELGKLQYLAGGLNISYLENVVNVEDVLEANLKDKKSISKLKLEWNGDTDDSSKAREILDRLEPAHTNLKRVEIVNYQGTSFSDWVGHHSYSCIKKMRLSGCKNCYWLPPLGQLPCLEKLDIRGFDMMERIGHEFYDHSNASSSSSSSSSSTVTTKPFKSLKYLIFGDMPQWKEWWSSMDGVFLNMEELQLRNCPKLNGECLPDYLPSLTTLELVSSEQPLASLSLSECQYPSLEELWVVNYPKMESFPPGPVRLPSNVKSINIRDCKQLVSFSEEGWPSNLKSLRIGTCEKLFGEQSMTKWNLQMLTSLTHLTILWIEKEIDTFPEEEGQLPTTLTSLTLVSLYNLKSLNCSAFRHLTSLQSLSISKCDELQSLPEEEDWLPTTLTSLSLSFLKNLKSLNGKAIQRLPSLKQLSLFHCKSLQCLPEETLPASLSDLNISNCPLLKPRCRREKGEDWPKIAHIPRIRMDPDDDDDI